MLGLQTYNYDVIAWSCPSPPPCGVPVHLVLYLYQSEFTWNQLVQVTGVNSLNYVWDFLGPPFPFGWFITYIINDIRYLCLGHFVQKKGEKKLSVCYVIEIRLGRKVWVLQSMIRGKVNVLKNCLKWRTYPEQIRLKKDSLTPPPLLLQLPHYSYWLLSIFFLKTSYLLKMETMHIVL